MSERSGQTAKGKDGKTKYASLNLFDTYKGKSLEAQKPVVPPRHGLQSLGKVASARRMPPPANLPSLKAENKGNDPNVSLVPKDGTGWASKQEPADPKSTDALSAPQQESQPPVASQTPALTRPKTPTAPEAPAAALGAGARSWAPASVIHGVQGDGGKGSSQPSPFSREEFPTLQAAGDQDRAGREQATADQWYGPGPSLRPQNVTSWRDGGGRALNAVLPGEGAAEGGLGGASVMEGAAGGGQLPSHQQNPPSHMPPRNPPANSPALPHSQPAVAPQFPGYRGIMPPFMYPPYLPFPAPYAPQVPYRYPQSAELPRLARAQGGVGADGRPPGGPRGGMGEAVKRPSILKQDDLKELDELDHDGDEGWAGAHEEIDYSAKLKFSDDEGDEEGEEERSEPSNGAREAREQQRTQEGAAATSRTRGPDSGGESRHTPPAAPEDASQPPSSKPGWAEEGTGSWTAQATIALHQGRRSGLGGTREQPSPPPGPLLGHIPYSYYRQDRPSPQQGSAPTVNASQKLASSLAQQQGQLSNAPPAAATLAPQSQGEDDDETWRQRRKQSSSEISAAVERARRRREEEERRMEEERRAACAEKLKRLDEKQQQSAKPMAATSSGSSREGSSPGPSLSAPASSPVISQPSSPCVDSGEPPLSASQSGAATGAGGNNRQRAGSNSSYDSNTESQQCPQPPAPQTLDAVVANDGRDEVAGSPNLRSSSDMMKVEGIGTVPGRQPGGLPSQGYSKYQKSLPPRFQRQQQEQLLKQQQWQQQQQQQHSQAAQNQLQPPAAPQGPAGGAPPQSAPKQPPLYPPGSLGRPPPLPMNFDPRWMMMSYMDPRVMQGRPAPMEYYPTSMHPSGLLARERSDSGGSSSDAFDRQQPHPGPPHPHRGTPPMDPKLAWGPDMFPGGSEARSLGSPLRQKQHDEEEAGKGLRSDTPPVRLRDGGTGPIQQPNVAPSSPSGSSNQTPPPPLGTQGGPGGGMPGGSGGHLPHHHQPFMGGRGNYSSFPDSESRGPPHQQQRGNSGGALHDFSHQDEGSRAVQQGQIWGAPHPHYDRNGRADLSPLENNPHLHHHHPHHPHTSHFPIHPHKTENGRERERGGELKKSNPSPPLNQPCISSSCSSSSSSSSSARDDHGTLQPIPPQQDHDLGSGVSRKQEKVGLTHPHSTHSSVAPSSHHPLQQQPHSKPNQRGREHKTETQWGPRPGSSSNVSSHNRKSSAPIGSNVEEELAGSVTENKAPTHPGGGNTNKRAGPIKRTTIRENKREGGESEGGEKSAGGSGKDKEHDCTQLSVKQDPVTNSHTPSVPSKDDPALTSKPRSGAKEKVASGVSKGSKDGDNQAPSSGYSGPSSRRDRERSYERSGGGGSSYHHAAPPKGNRTGRGRGGEYYGRGRGYRGTYSGSGSGGGGSGSRGRAGGRSGRDYRSSAGGSYHQANPHGSNIQDPSLYKGDSVSGSGRQGSSQLNPGRARNRSETRSEGSEYEEVPKRRRQRGSETGSESAASDLAHSDKEERKQQPKNGSGNTDNPTPATGGGPASSAQPRMSQTRVFTPRGVPSRRGRGGGSGTGGMYRNVSGGGGISNSHRSAPNSSTHSWPSKSSSSVRKQVSSQPSPPKDGGHSGTEKKEKAADLGHSQNQNVNMQLPSTPMAPPSAPQLPSENGGLGSSVSSANVPPNSAAPAGVPQAISGPDARSFPPRGFERPPRRRRHGRSQHQQDKPPRFRRLKQERDNAARINGGTNIIGGGMPTQRPATPSQVALHDVDGTSNAASTATPSANHNMAASTTNNNNNSHQVGANSNLNTHHHHHHYPSAIAPQHHHNHNPPGGAKSPDISNQNSDQANEEWETASESSDFTEFREREGGNTGGVARSYSSHHHHHLLGRGGGSGGGGVEREITAKESAANKRSFSSQRPGMERQNRRVNAGGGGRGPRGPSGGGGGPGSGSGNRSDRRGNWPSPKNRK
ncbi:protein PRRC2A isoform X1 [Paramormyrops kingsleyae]|uniref:Proline-rich coiled-coil 2A n=1 Tax=Paramormyrops kingsleyae TaxID=1676925 RepID=A0A3B3SLA4_9TELE|nr:protein PRRC2A-like isoform X1 [Paramormyrops kingsleyae]XP_023665449.1 protein PRRC2A-like isoform X1 [Paramormyrops kingsleyae]XP_023665450.1 protein PRRC2A-like isoform X1 [Paramormyrops kingsleyae]XP_023665451.1 protein PRRC2A-like isoform X1 [Paramormyrops kingsleyae]